MSRMRTIGRRAFLVGSVAVAGGVAFGTYSARRAPDNPLLVDAREGQANLNPWVRIDGDGITLVGPHVDLGQGAAHAQAVLIAEELDVDLDQIETSFGRPSPAYWNTAMAGEAVPFMATDRGLAAESMRGVVGTLMKLVGLQGTGGSTTMPDSFDKLRAAGASARETLKHAAANRTGAAVADLKTEGGAVVLPDGTRLPYTELAAEAALIEPVQDVALRDPSQWRLIGKPMPRLDMVAKSTGTLRFGVDRTIPEIAGGMVHAAVRTNPRRGGELVRYDAGAAKAVERVRDVIEVTGGLAVIADDTWSAIEGANALDVEWGPAPYPAEQADHWAALEASFTDDLLDREWRADGDVDAAIEGGTTIEAEYRCPYVAHAPMEPLNAIVRVSDGGVEVWTSHQFPRQLQVIVATVTGHDDSQVTLHNQYGGGSFGHRLEFEHVKQAAEIANRMRGTAVKLTYSREEDFAHDFPRHIAIGRAKGQVANGRVESLDLAIASPSVIASQGGRAGLPVPGPDAQITAGSWNNPYRLTNFRVRGYRAAELAPVSSWRSVGASNAGFVMDGFLDECIHAAGADPMEERIRLMGDDTSRKVLEAVAEMSSWNGASIGEGRGRGVAFVESFGVPTAEVVEVSVSDRGIKLEHVWIACEVGTVVDPVNFENQVQGGVVWGLGHAINSQITYRDGMAEQTNYHMHPGLRLFQCPPIAVRGLENGSQVRGVGEPPVPPAAPALANAIFAATGKRLREMPFDRHVRFV